MIATCLEKNPAARYASAAEVREALKTIMKALQIETGVIPGEAAANLPTTEAEAEKRATGFLSMLAERFRESAGDGAQQNSLVVLPFANLGATRLRRSMDSRWPMPLPRGWRAFRRSWCGRRAR